jgi:hypothetical protein
MGVEVKSGGEGVIVADRGCNDGCCCDLKNGQQEIRCLNRVVDAQRDQNIIQSVVAALKTTSTTPAQ